MTGYRDLLPVIVERENAVMPDGFDTWGLKSVRPDLKTRGGYQWPLPVGVAECDGALIDHENAGACPSREGDGLCVATTWAAMSSGRIPARTLILVATTSGECLGSDGAKSRHARVAVVAVVDGERLLRERGRGADLYGADLCGADLRGADLRGVNLRGADLCGADLYGANLYGANLYGADLCGADLYGADLYGADLCGADLYGADLCGADLYGADLRDANLYGADLYGADLYGANSNPYTKWPVGFDPSQMDVRP